MPLWHARYDLHMINLVTWKCNDNYMDLGIRRHLVGYNWAWQLQLEIWRRRKGKHTERYAGMIRRSVAVILSNSAPMSFLSTLRVTLVSFVHSEICSNNNFKAISEAIGKAFYDLKVLMVVSARFLRRHPLPCYCYGDNTCEKWLL